MTTSIRKELEGLVGPEAVLPTEELPRWRTGAGSDGLPEAVVSPASEEDVARVLERASREGWKVLPAGLGSWLRGGGPTETTVVLTTRNLDQIHVYEPADVTITAGSGLALTALRDTTSPYGQWLPLDPPGSLEGSLGATVTLGTGGSLRHLYGTPRDHVLGVTLVSGDGRILKWGGQVVKNVAGFDLTRLTVGSWGTLGVVTSVSARLFPVPEMDVTLLLQGADAKELLPAARTIALSPLPLASVELVDPGQTDTYAALAVRVMGSRAEVAEMESRVLRELGKGVGVTHRLEGDGSRRFHSSAGDWEKGQALVVRLALPAGALGALLEEAGEIRGLASGFGVEAATSLAAHVGPGVLRIAVSELPPEETSLVAWISCLQGIRSRLEAQGGSLTLSWGPDFLMREMGPWGSDQDAARLMAGLKEQLDPAGILAPGRLGLT